MGRKSNQPPLVVGITGASGAVYAREFLRRLASRGVAVHLSISAAGFAVIEEELGLSLDERRPDLDKLIGVEDQRHGRRGTVLALPEYFHCSDIGAPACSGSLRTRGMVVVPCSMGRLAAIAAGLSRDFIDRAADVTLKEGRRLVLVPRETPLNLIHIKNMLAAAQAGATVFPAMPGFYRHPRSVDELVCFLVDRILEYLEL